MSCEAAIAKLSYLLAEYDDTNTVKAKLEIPIRGEMEDTNYNRRRKSLRNVLFTEAVLAELGKFPDDEVCGFVQTKTWMVNLLHESAVSAASPLSRPHANPIFFSGTSALAVPDAEHGVEWAGGGGQETHCTLA